MTAIAIIAHEPMASALFDVARHVYQDIVGVYTFDIRADEDPQITEQNITRALLKTDAKQILLLTDLGGATPSNIGVKTAERLNKSGILTEVVGGANVCMLITAYSNRNLPIHELTSKVMESGNKGVKCLVDCDDSNQ